ncbi:hypothetical protein KDA11_03345 [Candidatus Saccharibacteria bacterium]|nr:hypothetical protein [Candidatus Saccharibacteria bacterium]
MYRDTEPYQQPITNEDILPSEMLSAEALTSVEILRMPSTIQRFASIAIRPFVRLAPVKLGDPIHNASVERYAREEAFEAIQGLSCVQNNSYRQK